MKRIIGLAVLVLLAAGLPAASAGSHARNAGIVWAQRGAIWGADIDGRHKQIITTYHGPYVDSFASPAWSPSGQTLAYNTWASDSVWLHLVRPASDTNRTLPVVGSAVQIDPTWSPDGRKLAISTGKSGAPVQGRGISAVSLSTRRLRTVTVPKFGQWDESPAWSPEGKTIAFTRWAVDGVNEVKPPVLYLVGQGGRGLKKLTEGDSSSWSPNGRSLVFGLGNGIFRIGADGRTLTLLVRVPGATAVSPRWSPDGHKILYSTNTTANSAIWVMNVDGTNRKRIVVIRGNSDSITGAAWRPG